MAWRPHSPVQLVESAAALSAVIVHAAHGMVGRRERAFPCESILVTIYRSECPGSSTRGELPRTMPAPRRFFPNRRTSRVHPTGCPRFPETIVSPRGSPGPFPIAPPRYPRYFLYTYETTCRTLDPNFIRRNQSPSFGIGTTLYIFFGSHQRSIPLDLFPRKREYS